MTALSTSAQRSRHNFDSPTTPGMMTGSTGVNPCLAPCRFLRVRHGGRGGFETGSVDTAVLPLSVTATTEKMCHPPGGLGQRGVSAAQSCRRRARPLTDLAVGDVRPIVRPKYSLTSQNPASLTWLKNSDPQPIASTNKETSPFGRSAAMPVTIPGGRDGRDGGGPGRQAHADRDQPAEDERRTGPSPPPSRRSPRRRRHPPASA